MFRHSPEPRRLDVQVLTTERLSRRSATSFSATQRSVQLPTLFSDVSTFRYRVRSTPRLTFSCGVSTETSRPSATAYRFGASVVQRRRVLPATRSFSCVVSLGDGDRSATAYCPASRGCSATTGVHSDLSVQRPTLPGATSMFSDRECPASREGSATAYCPTTSRPSAQRRLDLQLRPVSIATSMFNDRVLLPASRPSTTAYRIATSDVQRPRTAQSDAIVQRLDARLSQPTCCLPDAGCAAPRRLDLQLRDTGEQALDVRSKR